MLRKVSVFMLSAAFALAAEMPDIGEHGSGNQGVVSSPDGEKFVLVSGSGIRPDMFFEVYGETDGKREKLAEFAGVRGQLAWVDPLRFVFTLIDEGDDDIREGGRFHGLMYGLYLSVAVYDTATKEMTVLKKATETQNFSFGEVVENGNAVTVLEESVKSQEDWADEEKIETRRIHVEIPPANTKNLNARHDLQTEE